MVDEISIIKTVLADLEDTKKFLDKRISPYDHYYQGYSRGIRSCIDHLKAALKVNEK